MTRRTAATRATRATRATAVALPALTAALTGAVAAGLTACCPVPPRAPARVAPAPAPPAPTPAPTPAPPPGPPEPPPPPVVTMDWDATGVDWDHPPAAWPDTPFTPPTPRRFRLRNGVTVYLVENHRLPLVSVRVIERSAGSRNDGAHAGLAALTADLLDEGAGSRTALELPEELERLGARLTVFAGADHAQLNLDTLAETLEPSLAIAADVLTRPRLDPADLTRIKADRVARLRLRPDQPRQVAALVFERLLFGDHPYGAPGSGWVATVEPLTQADVKGFWKRHYGPSATTIVVAGDVSAAALRAMLERTLGGWKNPIAGRSRTAAPVATRPVLAFVDRPGAPQSVVTVGRLGPSAGDKARAAADVVNTAIGGSFASRLNSRLREELGYTYGVRSLFWRGAWGGAWNVSSSIRTDVTGAGLREILAIVDQATRTPMPAAELTKTRDLIVRSLPQDFETNGSIAGSFAQLLAEGRPLDSFAKRSARVHAVTAEAARKAAATYWRGLTIVVVGDWSAIGADLTDLGLPIVHYDAEANPIAP